MKTNQSILLSALFLFLFTQSYAQDQFEQPLNGKWLGKKQQFFEQYDYKKRYSTPFNGSVLSAQPEADWLNNSKEYPTRLEKDGLVTRENKKYFLLIEETKQGIIEMPNANIDPSKQYFIKERRVE